MNRGLTLIYNNQSCQFEATVHSLYGRASLQQLKLEFLKWQVKQLNTETVVFHSCVEDEKSLLLKELNELNKLTEAFTSLLVDFKVAEFVANFQSEYLLSDSDPALIRRLTYMQIFSAINGFCSEPTVRRRLQDFDLSLTYNNKTVLADCLVGGTRRLKTKSIKMSRVLDASTALIALKAEIPIKKISTRMVHEWLLKAKNVHWGRRLLHDAVTEAKASIEYFETASSYLQNQIQGGKQFLSGESNDHI